MRHLCLLLMAVTAAQALNSYVIIAPNSIRPSMKYRATVRLLKGSFATNLRIHIAWNGRTIVSHSEKMTKYKQKIFTLQIPSNITSGTFTLSAQGQGGVNFRISRTISFKNKDKSVFIQTDKGMYKPGDKVQFRAFCLYPTLLVYMGPMNIYIYDGAGNKIKQWLDAKGLNGVVAKEFELSSLPVLGEWIIRVDAGTQSLQKTFEVAKYVLPRFQVDVVMPSYAVKSQSDVDFKVTATYTYGKPVSGHMTVTAKVLHISEDFETSSKKVFFNLTDDIEGELHVGIAMSDILQVQRYIYNYKLAVKAEVVESLSGNVIIEYGYVSMYNYGAKLAFPPINPDNFKPGLLYTSYLTVTQPDGLPLTIADGNVDITIQVTVSLKDIPTEPPPPPPPPSGNETTPPPPTTIPPGPYPPYYVPQESTYALKSMSLPIPGNGLVIFNFVIPLAATKVRLTARYGSIYSNKQLEKSHSPSNSFFQLSLAEYISIKVKDDILFTVNSTEPLGTLVYQILSRGELISFGTVEGLDRKHFQFTLVATAKMAPNARIVIYYVRSNGEIVTDSIGFDVTGAFRNLVELRVTELDAGPGDETRIHIRAEPDSHTFLMAIDQRVIQLRSGNDVTPTDIYDELEKYDTISHSNDRVLRSPAGAIAPDVEIGRDIWWPYPIFYGGSDASKIFRGAGVIVLTDALVYKYTPPVYHYPYPVAVPGMVPINEDISSGGGLKTVGRIRTEFPETWIWTQIKTCASGEASVIVKVPDTITSWIASVFAVQKDVGFGISPTTSKIKVFKPFFVSLNLPYSVIRGEQVAIQAIIFNYMEDDQIVKITMPKSVAYYSLYIDCNGVEDRIHEDQVHSFLVKSGESRSVFFPIVTILLGYIDIEVRIQSFKAADGVRRQLLVEAEGLAMEFNQAVLIDLTHRHEFQKTLQIDLPPDIVEDSALIKISAIGDIMGPSISGLDKLLRLPSGCGEQTLLSLAPDVYITEYLQKTKQLSGTIRDKAISFMEKGYQQELTFKHRDGSFSAFGNRDKSGSMWLTAFVAKVFHQASYHIFIDSLVIRRAIAWMVSKQNADGSFPEPGRVIHKNMQGRAGSGVALTTFVFISLCENADLYRNDSSAESIRYHEAKDKALANVTAEVANSNDIYLMAMAVYAFHLAGSNETDTLLNKLNKTATKEGNLIYWHLPEEKTQRPGHWPNPKTGDALDTEVTSYVLETLAERKYLSAGRGVLQWVIQQRNPHGGFYSTQDTVIALQALSEFAELVFSDSFNVKIKVSLDDVIVYTFDINHRNALITQRRQSKEIPSRVKIEALNNGIALVEIAVFFNVEREVEDQYYSLNLTVDNGTINHFTLEVCASRLGVDVLTGMVVAEISILSGFDVDIENITKLDSIKKTEILDHRVIIYFDEMTSESTCIRLQMDRTQLVAKPKRAFVRVYDYYEPTFQVTGFYEYPLLHNSTICNVCVNCENCEPPKEGGEKAKR